MSGRIVSIPKPKPDRHECSPAATIDVDPPRRPNPSRSSRSTHRQTHTAEHPSGTVWQCDDCGTTWVAGRGQWHRERRFARWRRERPERRGSIVHGRGPAPKNPPPGTSGIWLHGDVHPLGGDLEPDSLPPSAAIKPPRSAG